MKKQIACTECKGSGYITLTRMYDDLCGIGCKPCPSCNGTGFHEVDMTNADRIRAMSDEDLEDFLFTEEWMCDTYNSCSVCPLRGEKGCMSILQWLKQPVEDEL